MRNGLSDTALPGYAMSSKKTIDIEGVSTFVKMLEDLGDPKAAIALMRRVLKKQAEPLRAAIQRNMPYDPDEGSIHDNGGKEYHVKDNVTTVLVPKSRRRSPLEFAVGVRRENNTNPAARYPIKGGLSTNKDAPNYAVIIEQDSHPIERAFDEKGESTIRGIANGMSEEYDKLIKRIARKAAKNKAST